jgi:hypothetical protein
VYDDGGARCGDDNNDCDCDEGGDGDGDGVCKDLSTSRRVATNEGMSLPASTASGSSLAASAAAAITSPVDVITSSTADITPPVDPIENELIFVNHKHGISWKLNTLRMFTLITVHASRKFGEQMWGNEKENPKRKHVRVARVLWPTAVL